MASDIEQLIMSSFLFKDCSPLPDYMNAVNLHIISYSQVAGAGGGGGGGGGSTSPFLLTISFFDVKLT